MKKILVFIIISLCVISLMFLIFISNKNRNTGSKSGSAKIQVTASFYPLYYLASEIGGNKISIYNMTPSSSEPHDYEPTTQDISRIEKSNLLIINGNVESWGNKIKDNLKGTNVRIIVAGDGLFTKQYTEEGKTSSDPHLWLSPQLAKKEAQKITEEFVRLDPLNSLYYQTNEKTLADRLDALDNNYKKGLSDCKQKDIITSHAAFAYLASTYGLNQVSISGLSPDSEPSAQQLAEVVRFAKEHKVKYIFFESLVSPKLSETIASEIGAKTLVLNPLEGLSDDEIKQGKNYFTVMADNLKNLQKALECNI
jgi:zinc transport system substrate-binding protein